MILKLYIRLIKWMRSMGYLKQPKRSYLYKGQRLPFYKAPVHSTSSGKLFIKPEEMFNSVKFRKTIDKLSQYNFVENNITE